jgi:hypothetical protein
LFAQALPQLLRLLARLLGHVSNLFPAHTLRFHLIAQLLEVGAQLLGDPARLLVQLALFFGGAWRSFS